MENPEDTGTIPDENLLSGENLEIDGKSGIINGQGNIEQSDPLNDGTCEKKITAVAMSSDCSNGEPATTSRNTFAMKNGNQNETVQKANDEIAVLLLSNKITNDESSHLQSILRENAALHQKISKLKLLLSRSSKANKDTKSDLEMHKKLLANSQVEMSLRTYP